MLSISLPRIFEDQGSGYLLRVSKVTLKWTGAAIFLTMGQLGSSLMSIGYLTSIELNCKVLAGGNAVQEQLREEPVGSQLTSLAPRSLQLVARMLGRRLSPPYLISSPTSC